MKKLLQLIRDYRTFRTYSPYKKALYCFEFAHIPKKRRMLALAFYQRRELSRIASKSNNYRWIGIAAKEAARIQGNTYESLKRLYYDREL